MVPQNIFQTVQTVNEEMVGALDNVAPIIHNCNKKYQDFEKANPQNIGAVLQFNKCTQFSTNMGTLVPSFEGINQRLQTLTVNQLGNIAIDITAEQLALFGVDRFMAEYGRGAILQFGSTIEKQVSENVCKAPFRFYGSAANPINSTNQIAQAIANFKAYGSVMYDVKAYLPLDKVPQIVTNSLNQFAVVRNNEMANTWEVGRVGTCQIFESNMLPEHIAGTIGQAALPMTIVSVTTNSTGFVTSMTASGGPASDVLAIKNADLGQFSVPDFGFLTFYGQARTGQPVQFRITGDAATNGGGVVTFTIDPQNCPLKWSSGAGQNLNQAIVAGMTFTIEPNHRRGLLESGNQMYLGMPPLASTQPYISSTVTDKVTGAALRMYSGYIPQLAVTATVWDAIWGSAIVTDNAMSLIFPI